MNYYYYYFIKCFYNTTCKTIYPTFGIYTDDITQGLRLIFMCSPPFIFSCDTKKYPVNIGGEGKNYYS